MRKVKNSDGSVEYKINDRWSVEFGYPHRDCRFEDHGPRGGIRFKWRF